jgi:hypothetical protein
MRVPHSVGFFVLGLVALVFTNTSVKAQASVATNKAPDLAGLYRIEVPGKVGESSIRYLRLLPDGRARVETVLVNTRGAAVNAQAKIGNYSKAGWALKTLEAGLSPQLCLALPEIRSCFGFHVEMPGANLPLYGPDALFGEPTIFLRRQVK